jgi:hypothetical protein
VVKPMAFFAGSKHGDLTQHWDEIPNLEIIYIYISIHYCGWPGKMGLFYFRYCYYIRIPDLTAGLPYVYSWRNAGELMRIYIYIHNIRI